VRFYYFADCGARHLAIGHWHAMRPLAEPTTQNGDDEDYRYRGDENSERK